MADEENKPESTQQPQAPAPGDRAAGEAPAPQPQATEEVDGKKFVMQMLSIASRALIQAGMRIDQEPNLVDQNIAQAIKDGLAVVSGASEQVNATPQAPGEGATPEPAAETPDDSSGEGSESGPPTE